MRRAHWLKGNPMTKIPKWHICVATTVWMPDDPDGCATLDRACIRIGRWEAGRWHEDGCSIHSNTTDFWTAMVGHVTRCKRPWLWLLNPAQDAPALRLTEMVRTGQLRRNWWVWGDPPTIISGKLYDKPITIVGVSNWLDPRKAIPELDLPPAKGAHNAINVSSPFDSPSYWQGARCAELVHRILAFVHREDLGHLRSTAGGQSLQSYRHLHMGDHKILVDDNRAALALERSCATGFPVCCHAQGRHPGPVWCVDVNSLYPWVMHAYNYPRKRVYHGRCDGVDGLRRAMDRYVCIARVNGFDQGRKYLVKTNDGCGYYDVLNNDALCGPDLDSAVSRGVISAVHEIACYDPAPLFREWGKWAWELRQRYKQLGDKVGELLAKSLSVSLWGKFAGQLGRWEPAPDYIRPPVEYGRWAMTDAGGEPVEMRTIAGVSDQLCDDVEPAISCPAISAFVACYARAFMQGIRALAGEQNVLYQCADALHVNECGFRRLEKSGLIEPAAFGKLKAAGPHTDAYYHAPNIYRIGGKWTHAGRCVDARETAPGVFEWDSPARLGQSVLEPMTGKVRINRHGTSLQTAADVQDATR
jgi:hypothetical protein